MANFSSPTKQTSPTNLQLHLYVRNDFAKNELPEFPAQSSLGGGRSNRKFMMKSQSVRERAGFPGLLSLERSKIGYRGNYPNDELLDMLKYGGERFQATEKPLPFQVISGSCSLKEQRQTPAFDPAAVAVLSNPGLRLYRRSHSMPPVLNDIAAEIEGGGSLLLSRPCADFIPISSRPVHADHSSYSSALMTQDRREQALRSHQCSVSDATQVTPNTGWLQGESSQPLYSNADKTSSDVVVSLHISDQNSSTSSTEVSCPRVVLNITPSTEGGRTSLSSGSNREAEPAVQPPVPISLESGRISREDEPPVHNPSRLTETSLGITAQVALAILTIRSSGNSSLSDDAKILLRSTVALNIIGFLCCVLGILVGGHRPGVASQIITGLGYLATVYGFVAIMGMQLDDDLKLWITGAAWIALFPVLLAFTLRRI